jgi:ornithine cyclodeaminase/alanine dehydrogenase-like protein (mu-crystallin family)
MKNVAIFGAGRIGRIHASNLAALPGVTLQYVCDPMASAAADLAQQLGARVSTIDAVLADKSIDVVAIASSTDTHSDLITRSAAAGKHIFCEKPVDMSVPRARECAAAVSGRRRGLHDRIPAPLRPHLQRGPQPDGQRRDRQPGDAGHHQPRPRGATAGLHPGLGRHLPRHADP